MNEIIFIVEESLEGGYEARALGTSIHTEAENLIELKDSIKDAVKCHYDENERPHIIKLHYVRDEVITL